MKFLTQVLPQVRRAVWSSSWFAPLVCCAFFGLEIFGRFTKSDVHDVVGLCFLMLLSILILERHRMNPIQWVSAGSRAIERIFSITNSVKFEIGIDFRGSPPIPRGTPKILYVLPVCLALSTLLGFGAWTLFPNGWRQPLIQVCYLAYLVSLLVLWGSVVLCVFVGGFFLPIMLLDRLLPDSRGAGSRLNRVHVLFVCYVSTMILAGFFVPFWVIPSLCGVALLAVAVGTLIPTSSGVQFVWRKNPQAKVWSITSRKMILLAAATIVLGLTALITLSSGNVVLGFSEKDCCMPVTSVMGVVLGWLVPGTLLSGTLMLWTMWKQNPSRPCRPSIFVRNAPGSQVREIRKIFKNRGWKLHFEPAAMNPSDISIRLVPEAESEASEFQPRWPLAVCMEDLRQGTVFDRLLRRDEIHKRRMFLRGLEKLFRKAGQRHHPGGSGYWLAPHQWLLQGMLRDDMDESDANEGNFLTRPVGPPYGQLLDRAVRHYLYVLMNSLQIDLIFVEDGVGYRKLNKVMRRLFEVYDKSNGQRRAEESQFDGMPKIKVMIHEFLLDQPFESLTYPEPRFENLGRARILHIFRNRGDEGVQSEPPFDFEFEPEPMLLV
ncbi:hypothetical protein KIH39_11285 [Telmatocola sphagniphila]|uniref:Uncharacterized protein n=1 Tax=Telmatocola sphagniphila TaxID=1123043 RepID=A0A8E6EV40_9BACT|nr:hypothetical protein [Telmatocola sphagniphila]QVL34459.1 hypothetical protein KIH39_11285 [Telmatocola sphagniphila]